MYAIIKSGGKQYRVQEGDVVQLEKLALNPGDTLDITDVLAVGKAGDLKVGAPFVSGAKVTVKVEAQGKGKKVVAFRYKPKKNVRRKQGHRQPYTQVVVEKIQG